MLSKPLMMSKSRFLPGFWSPLLLYVQYYNPNFAEVFFGKKCLTG
jgi:hypothetical protein